MSSPKTNIALSDANRASTEAVADPFTLEVFKNRLASVADEMAMTVMRTARSFIVKEALDYSTALFDGDGQIVAQGTCLPLHLGSMPSALDAVVENFGGRMAPGDIFALNDPYDGGTHLPDIIAVMPVFVGEELLGYSACLAHMTDMGGRVPGSMSSDSTEIFQEGLRLPPVRLHDGGPPVEAIYRIIARNVRVPDKVLGDLASQVAACNTGARALEAVAMEYGIAGFRQYAKHLMDYTERYTRAEIARLPDGCYSFTDHLDSDGRGSGAINICCNVLVEGDAMTIDFDGTSAQVGSAINSVHSFTASAAWACVRSILQGDIPNNAGYFRPIEVRTPPRSIVNPEFPAAVAARGLTGDRVADAVFGALAQIVPDRVPAAGSHAPDTAVSIGGYDEQGRPFVYVEGLVGSWGGGPARDGMDASTGTIVNYANTPVEMIEADQPLRVERYGFVADSGGPGRFRGGMALERQLRFLAARSTLAVRSDRHRFAPYGLAGGANGGHTHLRLERANGEAESRHASFLTTVDKGDLLAVQLPSGGGFGSPSQRDPEAVLRDVVAGKVTLDHARAAYRVALGGSPLEVLADETRRLRQGSV